MDEETEKRLVIANNLTETLKKHATGIMLGGSMGFGQGYSVTATSDIDLIIITDHPDILTTKNLTIPDNIIQAFNKGSINLIRVTTNIDNIELNAFIYSTKGYKNFCLLRGNLTGYKKSRPKETQEAYTFEGKKIIIPRHARPYEKGFLYDKPALVNGQYWGGVPRQDFFYSGHILHEKNSFFTTLEPQVWRTTAKQLIKEHGMNVNLNNTNILNTHYTYQTKPEKLPPDTIEKIRERTEKEIKELKTQQQHCSQ